MGKRKLIVAAYAILALLCALVLPGCSSGTGASSQTQGSAKASERTESVGSSSNGAVSQESKSTASTSVDENGTYTSKDEVALYLHSYGHLPSNYITKEEAQDAGWKTEGLDLGEACPGKSIGGDRFGNREGRLPAAKGRTWYECDIDYAGGSRGAKRIVYSNDGLIYYTEDHYNTFEQLY